MFLRRSVLLALVIAACSRAAAPGELQAIPEGSVKLLAGTFQDRARLNRDYIASLKNENLLQNFYLEAGLCSLPSA